MKNRLTQIFFQINNDALYKNSIYLMLSTAVMAFFGFFFWLINARLFTPDEVGLGTTLLSILTLISSFSLLGLNNGIIRYLPTSERKVEKINTAFTVVGVMAVVLTILFLIGLPWFSPKLLFLIKNMYYVISFIIFSVFMTFNLLIESVFIAYRKTFYVLLKNIIYSLCKLLFPFIFITGGVYAICTSVSLSIIIAFLISSMCLVYKFGHHFKPTLHMGVIKNIAKFSTGNYLAVFLSSLPQMILPVIITNKIGAQESAYFYMDMMIATFLFVVPLATAQSLFAEGSYSESELKQHLLKAIKIISILIVPAIILTCLFGNQILLAFGEKYSNEGFYLLRLLAISGIFISVIYIGNAILNIKHKILSNIILSAISAVVIISLSYLLIIHQLTGIGWAWIIGNASVSLVYLVLIKRYIVTKPDTS
jgi:O-antigen/teichoic acid export membrane protein